MTMPSPFRVDRFVVPQPALAQFMTRLRETQRRLDELAGCRQNLVLSKPGAGGTVDVVTIVEWADATAMQAARVAMQARYEREGFDPAGFMRELGVEADMGAYLRA